MKPSNPSVTVRQSLRRLGQDIRIARLRRKLSMALIAERASISLSTLSKIEKGDFNVSLGNYAAVLWAIGLGTPFGDICDPAKDKHGLTLEIENLPKRIKSKKVKNESGN